jgi:hypothetical protein
LEPTLRPPHVRPPRPQQAGCEAGYRSDYLANTATESKLVAQPLKCSRSGIGVRTATSPAKGTERLTGYYAARDSCVSAVVIVIGFLRGQPINLGTPPGTSTCPVETSASTVPAAVLQTKPEPRSGLSLARLDCPSLDSLNGVAVPRPTPSVLSRALAVARSVLNSTPRIMRGGSPFKTRCSASRTQSLKLH